MYVRRILKCGLIRHCEGPLGQFSCLRLNSTELPYRNKIPTSITVQLTCNFKKEMTTYFFSWIDMVVTRRQAKLKPKTCNDKAPPPATPSHTILTKTELPPKSPDFHSPQKPSPLIRSQDQGKKNICWFSLCPFFWSGSSSWCSLNFPSSSWISLHRT